MATKPKILVVEDNVDHREHLRDALCIRYDVVETDSQEGCLAFLGSQSFDLVVLDYYLKSCFSGLDLLREIRNSGKDIPVVMVTAYGNEDIAVEAMKSGASDYVRKTLDNSYIDRIFENVDEILTGRELLWQKDVKQSALNAFQESREPFIRRWRDRLDWQLRRIGLPLDLVVDDSGVDRLFSAYLADIQNDRATETLVFLKRLILLQEPDEKTLVNAELLNITFRDIAREILRETFPNAFDQRAILMGRIAMIVDENDCELTREYQKMIAEAIERVRQSERLATKSMLMTTLHHEIRQPLSYIYNAAEMIARGQVPALEETALSILEQAKRIELILTRLEKDGMVFLKEYAADRPILDIPEASEKE